MGSGRKLGRAGSMLISRPDGVTMCVVGCVDKSTNGNLSTNSLSNERSVWSLDRSDQGISLTWSEEPADEEDDDELGLFVVVAVTGLRRGILCAKLRRRELSGLSCRSWEETEFCGSRLCCGCCSAGGLWFWFEANICWYLAISDAIRGLASLPILWTVIGCWFCWFGAVIEEESTLDCVGWTRILFCCTRVGEGKFKARKSGSGTQ